jgi:ribosomal protein S18 acetylase RimI-like enzyme
MAQPNRRVTALSHTIKIRPFQLSDLEEITILHQQCFAPDENYSVRLGRGFLHTTYRFFLVDAKSFGFVAECEGKLVGFITGRLDYYTRELNRYRKYAALLAFITHLRFLLDKRLISYSFKVAGNYFLRSRTHQTQEVFPSATDDKIATLASLGVHPEYIHLRISNHLLSAAEEFCRRNGMLSLRAGIRRANIPARFSYRRRGYVENRALSTNDTLFYFLSLVKSEGC